MILPTLKQLIPKNYDAGTVHYSVLQNRFYSLFFLSREPLSDIVYFTLVEHMPVLEDHRATEVRFVRSGRFYFFLI